MNEEWRSIPGYDGYEVSNLGRVRGSRGWILKPLISSNHHYHIGLFKIGKRILRLVHSLVLEAFVGPCPDGMECRHLDGDPANNRLDNLRWGTHRENEADKILHGTARTIGETNPMAKLTDVLVLAIRQRATEGLSGRKLAAIFNISPQTISHVLQRRTWKHL